MMLNHVGHFTGPKVLSAAFCQGRYKSCRWQMTNRETRRKRGASICEPIDTHRRSGRGCPRSVRTSAGIVAKNGREKWDVRARYELRRGRSLSNGWKSKAEIRASFSLTLYACTASRPASTSARSRSIPAPVTIDARAAYIAGEQIIGRIALDGFPGEFYILSKTRQVHVHQRVVARPAGTAQVLSRLLHGAQVRDDLLAIGLLLFREPQQPVKFPPVKSQLPHGGAKLVSFDVAKIRRIGVLAQPASNVCAAAQLHAQGAQHGETQLFLHGDESTDWLTRCQRQAMAGIFDQRRLIP